MEEIETGPASEATGFGIVGNVFLEMAVAERLLTIPKVAAERKEAANNRERKMLSRGSFDAFPHLLTKPLESRDTGMPGILRIKIDRKGSLFTNTIYFLPEHSHPKHQRANARHEGLK